MKRTADRLFGDQYRWSVLGAGSSQMRIAADGGRDGRQRARRPRRFALGRPRATRASPMPSRCGSCARSWKGSGWRSRRPTRRARSWRSREPTRSVSDRRRHPQPHRALTRAPFSRKPLIDLTAAIPLLVTARSPCQRIRPRAAPDTSCAGFISALRRIHGQSTGRRVWTSRSASKRSLKRSKKLSNWGRWGKDDHIGTLNHVTPEDIVAAAKLVKTARLRARHPARPDRTADRTVRRPLQSDSPDARHRHRRHCRPAGLEQDPLRRRHADAVRAGRDALGRARPYLLRGQGL